MSKTTYLFLPKNPYFTKDFFSKEISQATFLPSLKKTLLPGTYKNLLYSLNFSPKKEGLYISNSPAQHLKYVCIVVKKIFDLNKLPVFTVDALNILEHSTEIFLQRKQILYKNVFFENPLNTFIDEKTSFKGSCTIGNGVSIYNSIIEDNVIIEPFSIIKNSTIQQGTLVKSFSTIEDSIIQKNSTLGPSCYIKKSSIGPSSVIGFCVEISQSQLKSHNKIKHLTYIGSTLMGSNNNIGAGTITCNFDGTKKHTTIIDNDVFIGANTNLIAPIHLHSTSSTGAGSTIKKNVPKNTLSLTRSEEVHKKRKNNVRNRRLQK